MSKKNKKIQDKEQETVREVKAEETEAAEEAEEAVAEEAEEAAAAETEEASAEETEEAAPAPEKNQGKKPGSGKGKRIKHGALSVVFTVIFVAAIVLINIIFNMVLDRFDITADLTDKALYSIEDSTAKYLAGVDDSVSFTVTADENAFENSYEYFKQVSEIAKRFAASNPGFTIEYRDLDENPTFYAKYGNTLSVGSIIVESAKTGRYVIVTDEDYLSPRYLFTDPYSGSTEEITLDYYYMYAQMGYSAFVSAEYYAAAERSLLSAVMNVTNENPVRVAFITGYGANDSSSAFGSLLESNAFTVENLEIETVQRIDSDIDFAVILAPLYDYSNDDINKLDMWLDNGGMYGKNLLYVPAAQVDVLPNLNSYIREWGLSLESGYVYQTSADYGYVASPTYQQLFLEDSDYSGIIDTTTKATQADRMKAINILFEESSVYVTAPIVSTYSGAVIAPFDMADWDPSKAEGSGTYVVAAESNKTRFEGIDPYRSRLFIISGEYFLDEAFLSASSINNADIALSIFNTASEKENVEISVTPKAFGVTTFEITGSQAQAITIVFAAVIPVLVIAAGVIVIIRRKRR